MAEEKPADDKKAAVKAKGGKGKTTLILAVVGVLALGGGGFAAYRYMSPAADAHEGAEGDKGGGEHAEEATGTGIVTFEPFVANLADPGGSRFARISIRLIVGDEEEAAHVQENQVAVTRLRAEILDLLMAQTAERLVTPEGKAELRKVIAEHAAGIVKPVKVSDVLFSDFVVQF